MDKDFKKDKGSKPDLGKDDTMKVCAAFHVLAMQSAVSNTESMLLGRL